ncbi:MULTISPECIES: hypothetical protein [Enterobacterales]|uniref:Inner membrane protein n=2 Tax=Enterobacteriaceae TaxID=543 RepID=A0AAW9BYJ1_KLUCR|nr:MULTISPECIES: hypothetical protein [Enterobacterales]MCK1064464.1 hypothetical protein [Klebsiella pneumoniae]MCL8023293.1 hypothetical protein [Klebsiella pneumoniae]MCS4426412.1 hypothetical protein [Klebsiella quasipneumoniae subsp. similipneumoniae]MCS4445618.1 hypothetical protein [Klebsiella pneumoniae]MCW9223361.1 hypothetical protein [Klebsiella quasipneumoniae]
MKESVLMSNPYDLSMYSLLVVMVILALVSTWYAKDHKINFYLFLLSIVTFVALLAVGLINWFVEGSVYGALITSAGIICLSMTRLRLLVYRYSVKASVKSIVSSVTDGRRVVFIAHDNLDLREVVLSLFSHHLPTQSRVVRGPLGFGMDNDIDFIKQHNLSDQGYLVIFLNQEDSYTWLKLIADGAPEKAVAFNFDYIPDLESKHENE